MESVTCVPARCQGVRFNPYFAPFATKRSRIRLEGKKIVLALVCVKAKPSAISRFGVACVSDAVDPKVDCRCLKSMAKGLG